MTLARRLLAGSLIVILALVAAVVLGVAAAALAAAPASVRVGLAASEPARRRPRLLAH